MSKATQPLQGKNPALLTPNPCSAGSSAFPRGFTARRSFLTNTRATPIRLKS